MAREIFAAAFLALAAMTGAAHAKATVTVLHVFDGAEEGCEPRAGVTFDRAGNLYGTAFACGTLDKGVVYKLAPDGTFDVLSDFPRSRDGRRPEAELVLSPPGNIYGVTLGGGTQDKGTVFEMKPDGHITILHDFTGGTDGGSPGGALLRDAGHNLYGVTGHGGEHDFGLIFKVSSDGTYSVLHTFSESAQGAMPNSGLIADTQGNLYGAADGGAHGEGIVYKLTTDGTYSVLYSFGADFSDGTGPLGPLALDDQGNLYGTTGQGGAGGSGTIFKLAPDGTESILHSFLGPTNGDGSFPNGVILVHGTLYGTTQNIARDDLGTVFKYTLRSGRYRKIYTFRSHDGYLPLGKLAQGPDGALYGTTSTNGQSPHAGTIFRLEEK